jgi:hypothetical protein
MVAELLTKYVWLVNTFIKAGDYGLSLEEIMDKWEDKWNASYSRRSFNNHREAIEEVFAIRIECNRKNNRYYIGIAQMLLIRIALMPGSSILFL